MAVHLLGKSFFGSLFQLSFSLLLLIQLSSFSCFFFRWCEFFHNNLTGTFSLKQVSSGFQDSSKYSSWSSQCCGIDGLRSSSDLGILLSLQVSRTLLSILAGLNSTVVWMVSFSCSCGFLNGCNYYWYTSQLHIPQIIQPYLFVCVFRSFVFTLWIIWMAKSTRWYVILFIVINIRVWFSGRDSEIHLYLDFQKDFMHHIFLERFWFVHIPFVSITKFLSLVYFQRLYQLMTFWKASILRRKTRKRSLVNFAIVVCLESIFWKTYFDQPGSHRADVEIEAFSIYRF